MNSIAKGRVAEAKVVAALVEQGWEAYLPAFGNGHCDVIACRLEHLLRIETKYVGTTIKGAYVAALRQVRSNLTTTVVKKFNSANADRLAVYIAPIDVVVFLDTGRLHGQSYATVTDNHIATCQELMAEGEGVEPSRP